jgi:hypothetical protein
MVRRAWFGVRGLACVVWRDGSAIAQPTFIHPFIPSSLLRSPMPLPPTADPSHDHTLDASLRSWVPSANDATTDFPPQNLPFCSYIDPASGEAEIGCRIGDQIVRLPVLHDAGLLDDDEHHNHALCDALVMPTLNHLVGLGKVMPEGTMLEARPW